MALQVLYTLKTAFSVLPLIFSIPDDDLIFIADYILPIMLAIPNCGLLESREFWIGVVFLPCVYSHLTLFIATLRNTKRAKMAIKFSIKYAAA